MVISICVLQLIYQRLREALQSHVNTWLRKLAEKSNLWVWGKGGAYDYFDRGGVSQVYFDRGRVIGEVVEC